VPELHSASRKVSGPEAQDTYFSGQRRDNRVRERPCPQALLFCSYWRWRGFDQHARLEERPFESCRGGKGVARYYDYWNSGSPICLFRGLRHRPNDKGNAVQSVAGSCQGPNARTNQLPVLWSQRLCLGKEVVVPAVIGMRMRIHNAVYLLRQRPSPDNALFICSASPSRPVSTTIFRFPLIISVTEDLASRTSPTHPAESSRA